MPYLTAAGAVAAAALIRAALDPLLHDDAPLLIFVLAVMVAGRFGGVGAGLAATVLSALVGDYFFIQPRGAFLGMHLEDKTRLVVFVLECIAVVVLTERLRAALDDSRSYAQHLRAQQAQLEQMVAERTAELQSSNDALHAFAYSMSHDLRAPLRAMSGFAQAVMEDFGERLPEQGRDYLRRVINGGKRMDRLIDRLLAYNRLSRSKAGIARETVRLDESVTDVLHELAPEIAASGTGVDVNRPLGAVLGHPETVRQILLNLIANAIKFSRPGQAPVVRIWSESANGKVKMHVADEGLGVAEQDRHRIFQPFERTAAAAAGGSGLGLAIVARGVERMGGSCGVEPTPSGGADFWILCDAAPEGDA